jgi:hypothetical protein
MLLSSLIMFGAHKSDWFSPQVVQERLSHSFQATSSSIVGGTTPSVSKRSIVSGQPLESILYGGNIIQTSTDPIKHKIVAIEHANEEIVQQTQHFHQELVVVSENHDQEHSLHA